MTGGIRTPIVDAPRAVVSGDPNDGGSFCTLFGRTVPFTADRVTAKYANQRAYVEAFTKASGKAVKAGFLLAPDARRLQKAAGQVPFPGVG